MITKIKENYMQYFFLFTGFFMCSWIIFIRLIRVRLPKDLITDISLYFVIIAIFSSIFLFLYIKNWLRPKTKESWYEKYELYQKLLENLIIVRKFILFSYFTIYKKTLGNENFPGGYYLDIYKIYEKFRNFCKEDDFFILFICYYFPQTSPALVFFIEVIIYHQIKIFYLYIPIYFISILFNVIFLIALYDFGGHNLRHVKQYIYCEKNTGIYKIQPDWEYEPEVTEDFINLVNYYKIFSNIVYNMGMISKITEEYNSFIRVIMSILYLSAWMQIILYYFCHIWINNELKNLFIILITDLLNFLKIIIIII